jgi:predicted ribosome quality control (RQC) complex YloA/Tae2 family protein
MRINQYLAVFATELSGYEAETQDPLVVFGHIAIDSMKNKEQTRLYKDSCSILDIFIKRKEKHLKDLKKQLDNAASSESFRIAGELLMANLYRVKPGVNSISLFSWEEEKERTIVLDPRISVVQNAQKYFKKYRKTNIKDLTEVSSRIDSLERSIKELHDQKMLLGLIDDINVLREVTQDISEWIPKRRKGTKRSRKKSTPPHLKYIWRDHIILVGTNARGNRFVTFDQARPWDLWFHVHEMPGSHVIVKQGEGRKITDDPDTIYLAASLAAYYSKARNSSKVQVDYTAKKNVRHIHGSGIAHVTYSDPETLMVNPLDWKEYLSDTE